MSLNFCKSLKISTTSANSLSVKVIVLPSRLLKVLVFELSPKTKSMCYDSKAVVKEKAMANKKKHSPEQIVKILRDIEIEVGRGVTQEEACRKSSITLQTFYRWRNEFGGLKIDQARRLKELEAENQKLRKVVADLALDNSVLKEINKGNF